MSCRQEAVVSGCRRNLSKSFGGCQDDGEETKPSSVGGESSQSLPVVAELDENCNGGGDGELPEPTTTSPNGATIDDSAVSCLTCDHQQQQQQQPETSPSSHLSLIHI